MKDNNAFKYYSGIDQELRLRSYIIFGTILFCIIVCFVVCVLAFRFAGRSSDRIFVVDKGSTVMASMADGDAQRDLEIEDHVRRFHQLMFNLAPSAESQDRHLEQALHMADRSAYDWWQDQSESGYFSRLVSANISQEILIDSVKLDIQKYPHPAVLYGKVFLTRESNITAYDFVSSCQLTDVARSRNNPHGLMIERFEVRRYENLGTRKRR